MCQIDFRRRGRQAPAALQDDATEDCELCDAYEAWDGTGDCPEMPTFVYDMTMDEDERRFTKPFPEEPRPLSLSFQKPRT